MWGYLLSALFGVLGVKVSTKPAQASAPVTYGPPVPDTFYRFSAHDIDILARTIYGEARGESYAGKQAVASVVMNRYKAAQRSTAKARQYGNTIAAICQKPYQFSCWLRGDPNYTLITTVKDNDAVFVQCKQIASNAVRGLIADNTNGADHYHTRAVAPDWSAGRTPIAIHGTHRFFKLG